MVKSLDQLRGVEAENRELRTALFAVREWLLQNKALIGDEAAGYNEMFVRANNLVNGVLNRRGAPRWVVQSWLFDLTMQQQSVVLLACRGPDGVAKHHPCKAIVRAYRATVLMGAYIGRPLSAEDRGVPDSFMEIGALVDDIVHWHEATKTYFAHVDELPHHYHMHLWHGAEIIGYKHPDATIRSRWDSFHARCAHDAHVTPETEAEMDRRLNDQDRKYWIEEGAA